jgi:hypothetical protein
MIHISALTIFALLASLSVTASAAEERSWNANAERVAKAWFMKEASSHNLWADWLSKQAIAVLHPTASGSTTYAPDATTITKTGPIVTVTWSMKWQGGMGSARSTTLRWKFTERQSLIVDVVADDGAFGVGDAQKTQLKDHFASSIHPLFVENVLKETPLEQLIASLTKASPWADKAAAMMAASICAGGQDIAHGLTGVAGAITVPGSVNVVSRSPVIKVQASVMVPNAENFVVVAMTFTQDEALGVSHDGKPAPQAVSEWFNSVYWPAILEKTAAP